jgi:hypothetical protein
MHDISISSVPHAGGEHVVVGDTVIVPVAAGDVAVGGLDD